MKQLPTGNELFLDHVGYFLADLEGAAERFGRLGFTVSPVNIHYNSADGAAPTVRVGDMGSSSAGYRASSSANSATSAS